MGPVKYPDNSVDGLNVSQLSMVTGSFFGKVSSNKIELVLKCEGNKFQIRRHYLFNN
jgi:hypothetical protein